MGTVLPWRWYQQATASGPLCKPITSYMTSFAAFPPFQRTDMISVLSIYLHSYGFSRMRNSLRKRWVPICPQTIAKISAMARAHKEIKLSGDSITSRVCNELFFWRTSPTACVGTRTCFRGGAHNPQFTQQLLPTMSSSVWVCIECTTYENRNPDRKACLLCKALQPKCHAVDVVSVAVTAAAPVATVKVAPPPAPGPA